MKISVRDRMRLIRGTQEAIARYCAVAILNGQPLSRRERRLILRLGFCLGELEEMMCALEGDHGRP